MNKEFKVFLQSEHFFLFGLFTPRTEVLQLNTYSVL